MLNFKRNLQKFKLCKKKNERIKNPLLHRIQIWYLITREIRNTFFILLGVIARKFVHPAELLLAAFAVHVADQVSAC